MGLFVAGRDQSAADWPNCLAEGHPPQCITIVIFGAFNSGEPAL
jgi:hypothetical protein